jgi:cation transport ATPase
VGRYRPQGGGSGLHAVPWDGISDALAMQAATVGVAFGVQSDITSEAADAVILETSLGRVDELIHIARRMRRIALQSAIGGMALSILGMFAAAFGCPNRWGNHAGNH